MLSILIVGAGPTGLTMAAVLARYGIIARVIDKAVVPPADRSRAIVIQARTLELFEDLGIVDEVLGAALIVEEANVFLPSGKHGTLRFRREWIESRYGSLVTLPQDETERILGGLAEGWGVTVEHGVELVGIDEGGGDAGVVARLRHADGRSEEHAADWVIGCDGAHSGVRHAAGIPFPGSTYHNECLLGDVDLRWTLPEGELSLCPHEEGVLLAFPLPGAHHFRIIMILPATGENEDRELSREEFLAQLTRMAPGAPPEILATRWLTRYRLHSRGVPVYRKGHAFVAGDAAHIHSPAGGQGMNTGIQDAYNLGWKLALVCSGDAPASILDSYHEERHRVGEYLLRNTDRLFAVIAGGGRLGRFVRRFAPSIAVRIFGAPIVGRRINRFISQTGIRYRHSTLSTEGLEVKQLGRHAPRAGDRVPDVDLGESHRLFELLQGGLHTLLLFAHDIPILDERLAGLATAVSARYAGLVNPILLRTTAHPRRERVVLDPSGAAHARFGAEQGAIYLVRPDGYVGFRTIASDIDGVWRALAARLHARLPAPASGEVAR